MPTSRLPTGDRRNRPDHLKRLTRRAVRRLGFDLIRHPAGRRRDLGEAFGQLAQVGIDPCTVIDVGVGTGTPDLYRSFPSARFLLVDPVAESEATMQRIVDTWDGEYVVAAAASRSGSVSFHVAEDDVEASTMFVDQGAAHQWSEREVPTVRLDDLVAEHGFGAPFLIKADVQGAELDVLAGAEGILAQTEAVALEVSLFEFFRGAPLLAEVVAYMKERDFVTYDIVGGDQRPVDGALAFLDFVFVSADGPCRQTNRYRD